MALSEAANRQHPHSVAPARDRLRQPPGLHRQDRPVWGDMRTMPGLGTTPATHLVDIDRDGNTINLS
jgi:hypothetical protein